MKFSIGNVSRLFGISPQTIHHYEKIGLIEALRDESNSYRYFDEYGFQQLATIRKLRNAGFALKDSSFVYKKKSELDVYEEYKKRKQEAISIIKEQQQTVERLDGYLDQMERLWLNPGSFKLVEYDGFYRFDVAKGEFDDRTSRKQRNLASKWYRALFHTASSVMFDFDGEKFSGYSYGVLADKATFQSMIDEPSDNTQVIPGGVFASRVFTYNNSLEVETIERECIDFLHLHDYRYRSNPFTRLIVSYKDYDDNKVNVSELLVPIFPPS